MTLLAVDPSLTVTGVAVLDPSTRGVVAAYRVRSDCPRLCEVARARSIAAQVVSLAVDHAAEIVVIESPARQMRGPKQAYQAQAFYGMACGSIIEHCHMELACPVLTFRADRWTRGVSKDDRGAWVAQNVPNYDPKKDPGKDAADAIELGLWFLRERERDRDEVTERRRDEGGER